MEIDSFKDLLQRISEKPRSDLPIGSQVIFNDYISINSLMLLIERQKEINNINVVREDFLTGEKTPQISSITLNMENTTFFIMAKKKISFSPPFREFWFGIKTEEFTDYLYCYPQNNCQTKLSRIDNNNTTTIDIRPPRDGKGECNVIARRFEKQRQENKRLDVNSIRKIAMSIFNNAVVSMNTFGDIAREYQAQQQDGSR